MVESYSDTNSKCDETDKTLSSETTKDNKEEDVPRINGTAVDKDGKALAFTALSCQVPHAQSFHLAWLSFFIAYCGWFSFAPLMPTVRDDLNLTLAEIYNANIASVFATIFVRVLIGPMCDRFGPRNCMAALLLFGSIPIFTASLSTTAAGLFWGRLCIGIVGGAFVPCQFWTSVMYNKKVVGTANGFAGGWGNLGGGFTYIFMPFCFNFFIYAGLTSSTAWRAAVCVNGLIFIIYSIPMLCLAWSSPYSKQWTPVTNEKETKAGEGLKAAMSSPAVIILLIQYALCFGMELAVNNIIGLYFYDYFTIKDCTPTLDNNGCRVLTQKTAGLIASLFGLMNLFCRAFGGIFSDWSYSKQGLKGRIRVQFICLLGEGISIIVFSIQTTLIRSILCLVLFSSFVQLTEGSTFGMATYPFPKYMGSVAGLVGAGGNLGAVLWGFLFKYYSDDTRFALLVLGLTVIILTISTIPFLRINGCSMLRNSDVEQMEGSPTSSVSICQSTESLEQVVTVTDY
jgi:NNP family nitrate/nitrite transporter-like MFS transporter